MSLIILGSAVLLNSMAISLKPKALLQKARRLMFSTSYQMEASPLEAEYVVAAQNFTVGKLAYSGTFLDLVYPSAMIPGQVFPEGGLIRGRYVNTSSAPLRIMIRVVEAAGGFVCEEFYATIREPMSTWDFWLPLAGANIVMPNRDWQLVLQMIGFY